MGISQPAHAAANSPILLAFSAQNDSLLNFTDPQTYEDLAKLAGSAYQSTKGVYESNPFVKSTIDGATVTLGTAIGGALACYTIDGAATLFFPPAAALTPYCAGLGAASTGGSFGVQIVLKAVHAR